MSKPSLTVVIPCFNEEGNIQECIGRVPNIGSKTEIIVIDDGSTDRTAEKVRQLQKKNPNLKLISYRPNRGKAWAVKSGFDAATGDVFMILDADMSVPPEELVYFYDVLSSGKADFVNGTRMVYPLEEQSMRILHRIGNKFFSLLFSFILNQHVTDTLCGTKALFKKDYRKITMGTEPWGDFDLLFGAARLQLKIREAPVHYRKRVTGESKMHTFRHGWVLLKMSLKGMIELKARRLFFGKSVQ